jgi:hypothetical protein
MVNNCFGDLADMSKMGGPVGHQIEKKVLNLGGVRS